MKNANSTQLQHYTYTTPVITVHYKINPKKSHIFFYLQLMEQHITRQQNINKCNKDLHTDDTETKWNKYACKYILSFLFN